MHCCCGCLFPTGTPPVHHRARGECAILVSLGAAGAGKCWADDDNDLLYESPLVAALALLDLYRGPSLLPDGDEPC